MNKADAMRQLCKMQGEVASKLGLRPSCVCGDPRGATSPQEVPAEVIRRLWSMVGAMRPDPQLRESKND